MVAREENHNSGMCSTSGSTHVNVNGRLASSLVDSSKDQRSRRWRGRRPSVEAKDYVEALRGSSSGCSKRRKGAEANDAEGSAILTDTKMVLHLIDIDLHVAFVHCVHAFVFCIVLWPLLKCVCCTDGITEVVKVT